MSALLFVLSFAFVQVQSIAPRVISSQTYFGLTSEGIFSGVTIADNRFSCRFNQAVEVIPDPVAGLTVVSSLGQVWSPVLVPDSFNDRGFDFRLQLEGEVDDISESFTLSITPEAGFFCPKGGIILGGDGCPDSIKSLPGDPLVVNVGLPLVSSVIWENTGLNDISGVLTFNNPTFADIHPPEMEVTVNGASTDFYWERNFLADDENTYLFSTSVAVDGSQICLNLREMRDRFGYSIPASSSEFCYTQETQTCGDWSEWSDTCIYNCIPLDKDKQFNVETRTRVSAEFPNCEIPDQTRECPLNPDWEECHVDIRNAETGDECLGKCQSGLQPSGCQCGGDCEEANNCCQSFYESCVGVEEATTNPAYFYKYAPCWTPSTCTLSAPSPPETFACSINFNPANGECDERPYRYGCYCGFNPLSGFTCDNVAGTDQCCSGGASQQANCDEQN